MRALLPFIKLFKHQWLMMFTGLVLSVTTLMAGIGLLSLSGWFLSAAGVAGLTAATAMMFNYFTPAGGVRFLSIVRTASRYGERLATHEATFKLLTQLRSWAWRKLLPLSASNMQGLRQGDLLNRLVADIDTLDHLYLRLLTPMAASLLMLGSLYLFVAWIDADLALVLCGSLLLVWLLLPWIFYFLGRKPGVGILESKRAYRIEVLEFIQGLAEISLFGADERFRARLAESEANLLDNQRAMANVTALSQGALILCHGLVVVLILYMAASGVGEHLPPGPMLAMIVFMTLACIEMLMPIAGAFQHLSACVSAAGRVNELVEQEPGIRFNDQNTARVTQGELLLENISFSYEQGEREKSKVLKGITLSIKPGEKVALLGQTGCGKSSLLSLITREWQPNSGRILLDGIETDQYSQQALTDGISLVSQRIYLFSGTLRDNLSLAQKPVAKLPTRAERRLAKDVNDKLLIDVLQRVGLSSLIQSKSPLDAWIGEGGRQLSGGEQRRIGVARVLLRDAPVLLLDEPTEGLDKRTEREILHLLFEFAKEKSVLMISHRLTAMAQMDMIHLMEEGQLRVSGSHDELLAQDDYYASLNHKLN
ncbi:cysteine/glutathione ABC transporter ATP-binding protein/permease CydC [Shewanella eurypsychrophilus]|uniref:Cysteine/glutathione ABC transporter ATP-binding protein/permease CydC n=1 Tax=Shewanella eurypsychrophilus TaxID=2593656 RepID=A0ABX6VA79_9GAMM|nr:MULTISPECIES: cysteine/glutathione ABC transporter ATP-binding protein/permease CydC [Shewanella]QFU24384.1 cysteine/glutathione ABC transporter ATP-binding protein/permease CydC [Shewanella sp. YLB-09]QPG59584.1 cysteine/glutathione ABC transporter ATP-binding protein/permease CydC [Shewanella eurypsychrophilus]